MMKNLNAGIFGGAGAAGGSQPTVYDYIRPGFGGMTDEERRQGLSQLLLEESGGGETPWAQQPAPEPVAAPAEPEGWWMNPPMGPRSGGARERAALRGARSDSEARQIRKFYRQDP